MNSEIGSILVSAAKLLVVMGIATGVFMNFLFIPFVFKGADCEDESEEILGGLIEVILGMFATAAIMAVLSLLF